ncbi:MAG: amidohydrolase family protein [Gemmatimonadaceae bacterium]
MTKDELPRGLAFAAFALGALLFTSRSAQTQAAPQQRAGGVLDRVIVGGRVMDPESKLDGVRAVGIRDGRVVSLTTNVPSARDTIDARGLVVAPGFIDLHSHGQDSTNYAFLARDGVTTALEMEIGTYPIAPWYADREGKARINYGASVSHIGARRAYLERDSSRAGSTVISADGPWARQPIPQAQLGEVTRRLEMGLRQGALGVGMGINYTEAASRAEIRAGFEVAARAHTPVFVHLRGLGPVEATGGIAGLQEVLADAASTGASLHVEHITSMGLGITGQLLQLIDGARQRGLDVTTEAYPYTAGSTSITAAILDEGFQQRVGIDYKDILYPATGERLTAQSYAKYRKSGGRVIIFMIPDSVADNAYRTPFVMVASDGGFYPVDGRPVGHPRGAGTHARILGNYVRERKVLGLMDAISRMTLLPAKRLESLDPSMTRKGRIRVGSDADLTLFDPARVIDKATYENAAQYSEGIVHVLVNGVPVVRDEKLVSGAKPGRAVRRSVSMP